MAELSIDSRCEVNALVIDYNNLNKWKATEYETRAYDLLRQVQKELNM